MTNPLNMINAITGKYYKKVENLISPIKALGISYFCWQTISHEGKWSVIGNHPSWLEYSAGNQFYLYDPSLIDPKFHRHATIYTAAHQEQNFQKTLIQDALDHYDLNYGLAIINKTNDGAEFAIFAAPTKNTGVMNTYINRILTLKNFIPYFKKEMPKAMCEMQEINVDMTQLKPDYSIDTHLTSLKNPERVAPLKPNYHHVKLTSREKECLYYTLRGKTAKDIARILCISHRTVELYIDNVRKKYGFSHKRDFFKLLSGAQYR